MEEKEPKYTLFFIGQENKEAWHLDSGCNNHMTDNKKTFIDVDTSYNSSVVMGNG